MICLFSSGKFPVTRPVRWSVLFLLVVVPGLLLVGCGSKEDSSSNSQAKQTSEAHFTDQQINRIIRSLEVSHEEYGEAFKNGTLSEKAEYREAQMGVQGAKSVYEANRESLTERNADHTEQIGKRLEQVSDLMNQKGSVSEVTSLLSSTMDQLKSMRTSPTSNIKAYRKHVAKIDSVLHAERNANSYRIGIFAKTPKTTFNPDGGSNEPDPDSFYLGITLREKRTKRYLPGSTVKVSVGDQTVTLSESWGEFHHYGTHVSHSIDPDAEITVSVSPPAYGRHAEMKSSYRESASVTFGVKSIDLDDHPVFSGPEPSALSADYRIGDGILPAIEESMELKSVGPYKVGFIVEGAEPFWTWSEDSLNAQSEEGENQNHLEIVLLDNQTNEPIPHASISLKLTADGTKKTVKLHPLLAEFYHYGANAEVPPGKTYTVQATIGIPPLQTFKKNRFTQETVTFEWTKSN